MTLMEIFIAICGQWSNDSLGSFINLSVRLSAFGHTRGENVPATMKLERHCGESTLWYILCQMLLSPRLDLPKPFKCLDITHVRPRMSWSISLLLSFFVLAKRVIHSTETVIVSLLPWHEARRFVFFVTANNDPTVQTKNLILIKIRNLGVLGRYLSLIMGQYGPDWPARFLVISSAVSNEKDNPSGF